jgi:hypothetical protein
MGYFFAFSPISTRRRTGLDGKLGPSEFVA